MDVSKYVLSRGHLIKFMLLVLGTIFIVIYNSQIPISAMKIIGIERPSQTTSGFKGTNLPKCPNVLKHMVYGTWNTEGMTRDQEKEAWKFVEVSRKQFGVLAFTQRNDSRCGDAPYNRWIRALCDPFSKTPCCFNNKCVARSIDECKCDNCRDMRQEVHAIYSKWTPFDRRCPVKIYDKNEACELLNGATLFLCGDSFMRHIYTALIIVLTNNTYDGALKKNIPKDIRDKCAGPYMFTQNICRGYIVFEKDLKAVCGGKTKILFSYYYSTKSAYAFSNRLKSLKNKNRSMAVFGVGMYDNLDGDKVLKKYILPAIKNKGKSFWPKMLWTTPHCPGIIKNVNKPHPQSKYGIWKYITHLATKLPPLNISYFNTFNMTDGLLSYDGTHYGMGVNVLKVQIILNYIQELKHNDIHDKCAGPYMFTEKICRGYVTFEKDLKPVCGGKTKILFSYYYSTKSAYAFSNRLKSLKNKNRSMAVFGVGMHDNLDGDKVFKKYILPAIKNKGKSYWPKMLWTTPHCPGIIKNANKPHPQSKYGVWKYITHLATKLPPLNISYFNTFNMTDGVSSYDGTHYGIGVNVLKVQIILNYIQELKNNGEWP